MAIDLKYGRVTTERGTIGDDEPVVVFRAQDRLLPMVLRDYRRLCEMASASQEHIEDIQRAIFAVEGWQMGHPTKTPGPIQSEESRRG